MPNGIKIVTDGVDAQGNATHTEISAFFDGKEYELKGAALPTTRVHTRIGRSFEFLNRTGGKVTTTTRVVVSADGKTLTTTTTGTDAAGQRANNVTVWERR